MIDLNVNKAIEREKVNKITLSIADLHSISQSVFLRKDS